jgi:hypothetical protein
LTLMNLSLLEEFRDRFVAVGDGDVIVAVADSMADLLSFLPANAPDVHVVIQRVPAPGEPLFVGLG